MPRIHASRELLAAREDVWAFLAEPRNLADWWPGLRAVQPDRRGLAPGARWQVHGLGRPSFVRRPDVTGTLVVLRADRPQLVGWQFTGDRIDVELRLTAIAEERTLAELSVEAPWFIGLRPSLARQALKRLSDLCQPAADA